jgi:hypothetical protein
LIDFVEKWIKTERLVHGQATELIATQQEDLALFEAALRQAGISDEQILTIADAYHQLSGGGEANGGISSPSNKT